MLSCLYPYFVVSIDNMRKHLLWFTDLYSLKFSDRPGVPCDLRATDIWRDYIQIAWGSPEDDGGSPITGYSIEQRDALEPSFRFLASLDQSTTSFQATNLKEGHDYYYRVFAHNMAGPGEKPAQMREPVKAKLPFGMYISAWWPWIHPFTILSLLA